MSLEWLTKAKQGAKDSPEWATLSKAVFTLVQKQLKLHHVAFFSDLSKEEQVAIMANVEKELQSQKVYTEFARKLAHHVDHQLSTSVSDQLTDPENRFTRGELLMQATGAGCSHLMQAWPEFSRQRMSEMLNQCIPPTLRVSAWGSLLKHTTAKSKYAQVLSEHRLRLISQRDVDITRTCRLLLVESFAGTLEMERVLVPMKTVLSYYDTLYPEFDGNYYYLMVPLLSVFVPSTSHWDTPAIVEHFFSLVEKRRLFAQGSGRNFSTSLMSHLKKHDQELCQHMTSKAHVTAGLDPLVTKAINASLLASHITGVSSLFAVVIDRLFVCCIKDLGTVLYCWDQLLMGGFEVLPDLCCSILLIMKTSLMKANSFSSMWNVVREELSLLHHSTLSSKMGALFVPAIRERLMLPPVRDKAFELSLATTGAALDLSLPPSVVLFPDAPSSTESRFLPSGPPSPPLVGVATIGTQYTPPTTPKATASLQSSRPASTKPTTAGRASPSKPSSATTSTAAPTTASAPPPARTSPLAPAVTATPTPTRALGSSGKGPGTTTALAATSSAAKTKPVASISLVAKPKDDVVAKPKDDVIVSLPATAYVEADVRVFADHVRLLPPLRVDFEGQMLTLVVPPISLSLDSLSTTVDRIMTAPQNQETVTNLPEMDDYDELEEHLMTVVHNLVPMLSDDRNIPVLKIKVKGSTGVESTVYLHPLKKGDDAFKIVHTACHREGLVPTTKKIMALVNAVQKWSKDVDEVENSAEEQQSSPTKTPSKKVVKYFYSEDGVQKGPVDIVKLAELVRASVVEESTLVWCRGQEAWEPYGKLPELQALVKSVPETKIDPKIVEAFSVKKQQSVGKVGSLVISKYYYIEDGQRKGPVSLFQLARLAANGNLTKSSLLWHKGLASWTAYKELSGLEDQLKTIAVTPPLNESSSAPLEESGAGVGGADQLVVESSVSDSAAMHTSPEAPNVPRPPALVSAATSVMSAVKLLCIGSDEEVRRLRAQLFNSEAREQAGYSSVEDNTDNEQNGLSPHSLKSQENKKKVIQSKQSFAKRRSDRRKKK